MYFSGGIFVKFSPNYISPTQPSSVPKNGITILDDSIAREVGEIYGIEVHGSLFLIFLMLRGKDGWERC